MRKRENDASVCANNTKYTCMHRGSDCAGLDRAVYDGEDQIHQFNVIVPHAVDQVSTKRYSHTLEKRVQNDIQKVMRDHKEPHSADSSPFWAR